MSESLRIDSFRVEPVKQDARHLISGDFKMVGAASGNTHLLKEAFDSGEMTNLAFVENGEHLAFPAFVRSYAEKDGIVTAIIRPASSPEQVQPSSD